MLKLLKRFGVYLLALVVAFGLLAAAGCKKTTGERAVEKMISKATGGKAEVDASGGTLKIKTAEGETQIGALTEWPSDLPGDLPKFDGRLQSAVKMGGADGAGWFISILEVKEAAVTDYVQKLKAAGWNEAFSTTANDSLMVQLTKENASVMLTFGKDKGELGLSVSVTKEN
jgi:hypothetical protein